MTTQSSQANSLLDALARKREAFSYGLIAAGFLMAVVTIFWTNRWDNGRNQPPPPAPEEKAQESPPTDAKKQEQPEVTDRSDYLPAAIWSGLNALLLFGTGVIVLTRIPPAGRGVLEVRFSLVAIGGLAGMLTALFGFVLAWRWQENLLRWINENETREARWIVAALAIFLGGLALMFFSVQLARSEERNDVVLRRMFYGCNAVLSGLLLLLFLSVVNVIVFLKMPENVITTVSAFKGLTDKSKEFLRSIDDDVQIYLIMPENQPFALGRVPYHGLYADCRALLNQCHEENGRIKALALSPATDADEVQRVFREAKISGDEKKEYGILIRYGTQDKVDAFIGARELLIPNAEGMPVFQGENRIMTELNFLSGGAQRPVIYFTQSNAEPSIGAPGAVAGIRTAHELVQYLTDRKYTVKPLLLETGKDIDLSDATMVVIAAPRRPFTSEQIDILDHYMFPRGKAPGKALGGKLVTLLPAYPGADGKVAATGLEDLLLRLGVRCESKRMLCTPQPDVKPQFILGTFADGARAEGLPITRALDRDDVILFGNVRPIAMLPPQPSMSTLGVNLLATPRGLMTYRDEQFDSDPSEIAARIRKEIQDNGSRRTAQEKQLTNSAVSFGAFVVERFQDGESAKSRPRLLAIGTDSFCSDDALAQLSSPNVYVALMGAMLDMVRERPQGMNIEPRALGSYTLKKDPDTVGLFWLPVGLVVLGIMALGMGVWVARRT
jgi:hypothetical protein